MNDDIPRWIGYYVPVWLLWLSVGLAGVAGFACGVVVMELLR